MISKKVMSYINMLSSRVMHMVLWNVNGTCIITKNINKTEIHTKVTQLLLEPQKLRTTGRRNNIFSFSHRQGNRVLFLWTPRDKTRTKKLIHSRCAFPIHKEACIVCISVSKETHNEIFGIPQAKGLSFLKISEILFTVAKWDSLGSDWNLAHRNTENTISGLLAIRYIREPIIPQ